MSSGTNLENGANLEIVDSYLFPECGANWAGIFLDEGSDISIINSTILNSNSISEQEQIADEYLPGIFSISNSHLINSPISLTHIDGYIDIVNSKFTSVNPTADPVLIIDGDIVNACTIINSDFVNYVQSTPSFPTRALLISDVGFVIDECSFKNFESGIFAQSIFNSPANAIIKNCTFTNNHIGIRGSVLNNFQIYSNKFDVKEDIDGLFTSSGITLNYCSAHDIHNNIFQGQIDPSNFVTGIILSNGGEDYEVIYENDFRSLDEAIRATGQNRDLNLSVKNGLQFICNHMSFSGTDIRIDGLGVHPDQGEVVTGVGNTFTNPIYSGHQSSIKMNSNTFMDYYREDISNFTYNYPDLIDQSKVTVLDALQEAPCYSGNQNNNLVEIQHKNLTETQFKDLVIAYNEVLELSISYFEIDKVLYAEVQQELSSLRRQIREFILYFGYENLPLEDKLVYLTQYRKSIQAKNEAYNIAYSHEMKDVIESNTKLHQFKEYLRSQKDVDLLKSKMSEYDGLYENLLLNKIMLLAK